MALHGWTKTLKNHALFVVLAVFLAACSSGDDGGPDNNGNGGPPPTLGDIPLGAKVEIVPVASWINPVTTQVDLTAGVRADSSITSSTVINFTWNIIYQPDGSDVSLTVDPTSAYKSSTVHFTPVVPGSYVLEAIAAEPGKLGDRGVALVEAYDTSYTIDTLPFEFNYHSSKPTQCANCHGVFDYVSSGRIVLAKPANHIDTTNFCQSCHTLWGFDKIRTLKNPNEARIVDHKEVLGACSTCHNNITAIGKSSFHVETQLECDECHTTKAFFTLVNGKFDHSGIISNCAECHDGIRAKGKDAKPDHIATTSDCSACHSTDAFKPALFDHSTYKNGCINCHTSTPNLSDPTVIASAHFQPTYHPMQLSDASQFECNDCHTTTSFDLKVTGFNHRAVLDTNVLNCYTCHDGNHVGVGATGPGTTAIHSNVPTIDCHSCHSTEGLFKDNFYVNHTSTDVTNFVCTHCHDGTTAKGPSPVNHIKLAQLTPPNPECNVCHIAGGNFANGTFDHNVYVKIDVNNNATPLCKSCHNDVISVGQAVNHIPTQANADCVDCHGTTTFVGATVDHNNLGGAACSDCHSPGNGATAQPKGHIPTSSECNNCHSYPAFDRSTLNFQHVAADYAGGCTTCHSGQYAAMGAKSKSDDPTTHIPTLDDCQVCHNTKFTNFTGGSYDHPSLNVDTATGNIGNPYGCEGCHNGKFKTSHNTILSKADANPAHIPTGQDCYLCHTDAGISWAANFLHRGITGDCVSCHDGKHVRTINGNTAILGKHAGHIASSDICSDCHMYPNALNKAFTWKSTGTFDHGTFNSATQKCEDCHIKSVSDANLGADGSVVIQYKSQTHQAYPAGWDCNACHAAGGSFIPATFDHNAAATSGKRCDSCHNGSTATGIADKPVGTHIEILIDPKTKLPYDCSACHNTTAFAGATFDHSKVKATDLCSDCHNGASATGKALNHVITGDDCRVCHQTTGWKPALFEHTQAQIGGQRCDSCHGKTVKTTDASGATVYLLIATGKNTGHVDTNQDCGVCHKTGAWIPAFFDHAFVTATTVCGSCHNGADAKGKSSNHFPTTRDCHDCHITSTFTGAKFDHLNVKAGTCTTCHITTYNAPVKPSGHIRTNYGKNGAEIACDECHSLTSWKPAVKFDHVKYGFYYSGDHRGKPGCSFCHGNKITSPYVWQYHATNPTLDDSCAGCHKNNFRSNGNHIGGRSGTVEQNKDCSGGGSGCHKVSSSGFG